MLQSCQKTCYQGHVIELCDCADPRYPLEGEAILQFINNDTYVVSPCDPTLDGRINRILSITKIIFCLIAWSKFYSLLILIWFFTHLQLLVLHPWSTNTATELWAVIAGLLASKAFQIAFYIAWIFRYIQLIQGNLINATFSQY